MNDRNLSVAERLQRTRLAAQARELEAGSGAASLLYALKKFRRTRDHGNADPEAVAMRVSTVLGQIKKSVRSDG
jgi:hypothetical protein